MSNTKTLHALNARHAVSAALVLALAATPLFACGSKPATDDGGSATTASQTASVDPSTWETLGDALANQTESMASGWNGDYLVSVFKAGDSYVRVVAKLDADTYAKVDAVDWTASDVADQLSKAAGSAKLVSADDITNEVISQEDLDKFAGKTGKDLIADGWTFENYYMYGGDQTGALMAKDHFAYNVTFDVSTPDSAIEDNGASIMDATISEMSLSGAAESATTPEQVG